MCVYCTSQVPQLARENNVCWLAQLLKCPLEISCREPASYDELLKGLQQKCGFRPALSDEDWLTFPRTKILVRREKLLPDALREARKRRFDPVKLLSVRYGIM